MGKYSRTLLLIGLFVLIGHGTGLAGFLRINHAKLDPNRWGKRTLMLPIENPTEDSARLVISLRVSYQNHYLSSEEITEFDTSYVIPPNFSNKKLMYFTLEGSFGRATMQMLAKWKHFGDADTATYDSTFQTFNNNFAAQGDITGMDNYRYALGPMHSAWYNQKLNYEYPRLLLYLSSRGRSVDDANHMIRAHKDYAKEIFGHFRDEGILPLNSFENIQYMLAVSESEGFVIRPRIMAFAGEFSKWYADRGKEKLDRYLRESGVDSSASQAPALRMLILHTLIMEKWNSDENQQIVSLVNSEKDISVSNKLRWIVQGGAFFQPRVCLSVFQEEGTEDVLIGSFAPDPSLTCTKLSLVIQHNRAKKDLRIRDRAISNTDAADILSAVKLASKKKLVKKVGKKMQELMKQLQSDLPYYTDTLEANLADYICRIVIGECFRDSNELMKKKFIAVRY